MANDIVQNSRDWLSSPRTHASVWGIPKAAIVAALFIPPPVRTGVWIVALVWMSTACILNSRRCGRTHCRYTGPYYLAMIAPALMFASGIISVNFYAWPTLAVLILGGSTIVWWATERGVGKILVEPSMQVPAARSLRATVGAIVGAPDRTVKSRRAAGPGGSVIDMPCAACASGGRNAAFDSMEVFGWSY